MSKPFDKLVKIMAKLRAPDGCPWDHEQTHQTLIPYLIEETYEVIEAIENKNQDELKEELGDLLLQVVFHAQMATEAGDFNIDNVINDITTKLVRRHPHVFGDKTVKNAKQVSQNWEEIKAQEKAKKNQSSVLNSIPTALPALFEAFKVTKKASKLGFDWDKTDGVLEKIEEEVKELRQAMQEQNSDKITEEMGDVFFSLVNLCRFLKVQPEIALKATNKKFRKRFEFIEQKIKAEQKNFSDYSLDQLDQFWDQAKKEVQQS